MFKKYKSRNNISNKSKRQIDYRVEITIIAVLTVALLFLGWIYIFQENVKYEESTLKSFSTNQELLVQQVGKTVQSGFEVYINKGGYSLEKVEEAVVSGIIRNVESAGNRYWFLYSEDRVIFEKDDQTTRIVAGKSLMELEKYWKLQGGSGIESLTDLMVRRQSGSIMMTKNSEDESEIISVKYFTAGDQGYFFGMATPKRVATTSARVNEHILYLLTFSAMISLNILIFSLLVCLKIYKHNQESKQLNAKLVDKNLKIQELNRKLSTKSEAVQSASIYDNLTKLYNRKFFDNILTRVNHELLMPVSIVILDINGLGQLNEAEGYHAGDELLEKTSEILHRVCIDTDIVARTGSSEFTILMTTTKEAEAYGTARNIRRQFCSLDNKELTLSIGVAQMEYTDESIFSVLEAARKNLILEKMLDANSSNNSIISMMMITLNAYSKETVSHSNRMRETAVRFGKLLAMPPSKLSRLAVAAQLHDVGKIGIPDSILYKKEALNDQERELIRRHSELGYNIVNAIPFLREVALDILQHHEAYDGTGYPHGIKGEEITLNARIINIIDSFDAMTNQSVYAVKKSTEEAVCELRKCSGRQFDPHLVNEFITGIACNPAKQ